MQPQCLLLGLIDRMHYRECVLKIVYEVSYVLKSYMQPQCLPSPLRMHVCVCVLFDVNTHIFIYIL